jgi:UDP:flavonoid glycosyltransferase YjiC (YdhE family)
MRTLFFGTPGIGHIVPQIPMARALRARGRAVAFLSAASMGGLLDSEGFELLTAGPEIVPDVVAEVQRTTGSDILADGVTVESEAEIFGAARIDLGYEDSLASARDWKPELIVAEMFDFIAPMVGAALGVPVATLAYGPAIRPESVEAIRVRTQERHRRFRLECPASRWYLDTCPPSLQFDDWQAPETRIALRPEAYNGGATASSGPATGKSGNPLVLVSFGTIFVVPEIITPIVRELLNHDVDVRVALGPVKTAADFGLDSDRVEFAGFTPLARMLKDVDVVLTVGGAGTVLGSLAHGIPLVMTPQGADQPIHAGRAAAAGAGIAFPLGECAPLPVGEAVATVLSEPGYRQAAQRIAAEIAGMPSADEVAERLIADLG